MPCRFSSTLHFLSSYQHRTYAALLGAEEADWPYNFIQIRRDFRGKEQTWRLHGTRCSSLSPQAAQGQRRLPTGL